MNDEQIVGWATVGLLLLLLVLVIAQVIFYYYQFLHGILGSAACTFMCGKTSPYRFKMVFYIGVIIYILGRGNTSFKNAMRLRSLLSLSRCFLDHLD